MGFFESLLIGFAISAIPGPIFFEIVRRTLLRGFWSGFTISIGDFIGNFFILLAVFFGLGSLLTYTTSKIIMFAVGGLILIWLGISAFKVTLKSIEKSYRSNKKSQNSMMVGLGIAASSPIVIAFWISLSGSYLLQFATKESAFLNIFCIALGFVFFHFLLAIVVNKTKHKIPAKYVVLLSKMFGIILIFYGLNFFYELYQL